MNPSAEIIKILNVKDRVRGAAFEAVRFLPLDFKDDAAPSGRLHLLEQVCAELSKVFPRIPDSDYMALLECLKSSD